MNNIRRRSSAVPLVLMGTALALSACNDDGSSQKQAEMIDIFTDAQSCAAVYSEQECRIAEEDATNEHLKNAPKFATLDDCVAEFGKDACVPVKQIEEKVAKKVTEYAPDGTPVQVTQSAPTSNASSGNFFMPFMLGYMLSDGLNSIGRHASSPIYYGPGQYKLPPDRREVYVAGGTYGGRSIGYAYKAPNSSRSFNLKATNPSVAKSFSSSASRSSSSIASKSPSVGVRSAPSVSSRGIAGSTGRAASVAS